MKQVTVVFHFLAILHLKDYEFSAKGFSKCEISYDVFENIVHKFLFLKVFKLLLLLLFRFVLRILYYYCLFILFICLSIIIIKFTATEGKYLNFFTI